MIPVCKPYWGVEEEAAALRVMRSGHLIQGLEVEAFEQAVAEYVGVEYAVATSSGTTALHLALLAMGVGRGDRVLVPAFTFVATANAVLMCGAKPVLCDINLETFCLGQLPLLAESYWIDHKVVVPVHAFGYLSKYNGPGVLEDAACALGTEYVGNRGRAAILSFHATKIITTGEGGMVLTNDPSLADKVRLLRDQKHGTCLAYNYRMTEIAGAIGCEQMKRLPWILEQRRRIAALYDGEFDGHIAARIPPRGGNYQSYVLLLDKRRDRAQVIGALAERGIEALPGTQFLGDMPHMRTEGLPNARFAGTHAMRIPIYPQMTGAETEQVVKAVKEVLR